MDRQIQQAHDEERESIKASRTDRRLEFEKAKGGRVYEPRIGERAPPLGYREGR